MKMEWRRRQRCRNVGRKEGGGGYNHLFTNMYVYRGNKQEKKPQHKKVRPRNK